MEIILLLLGFAVLLVTFMDFFHTTLSGRGFGILSGKLNELLGFLIMKNRKLFIYKYSGFLHLLCTTLYWLMLLILGTFIIFSSSPEMVISSETKIPATLLERFYYTGFVISTLGIGDFVPGNDFSRWVTTFLSFSGFILLTTALTYLVSVVNTVLQKKQLALYISTLGTDIDELYRSVTTPKSGNLFLEHADSIRVMIIKNASNFIFFPIIQYYVSDKKEEALIIQLSRMYEILIILSYVYESSSQEHNLIKSILATISDYLKLGIENKEDYDYNAEKLKEFRKYWRQHDLQYQANQKADLAINAALNRAGWTWEDVYKLEDKNASDF